MATFMVLADGETTAWRVDRDALAAAIEAGWAAVQADPVRRSAVRSFLWTFETEEYRGEAYLHEDGTCLYMDVPEQDAMRLAIVFRRLAPAGVDLVFCDEGYTFDVLLHAGASDAELIEAMSSA